MAVPKRKHSNARTGSRRAHNAIRPKQLEYCSKCSTAVPSHVDLPELRPLRRPNDGRTGRIVGCSETPRGDSRRPAEQALARQFSTGHRAAEPQLTPGQNVDQDRLPVSRARGQNVGMGRRPGRIAARRCAGCTIGRPKFWATIWPRLCFEGPAEELDSDRLQPAGPVRHQPGRRRIAPGQ